LNLKCRSSISLGFGLGFRFALLHLVGVEQALRGLLERNFLQSIEILRFLALHRLENAREDGLR